MADFVNDNAPLPDPKNEQTVPLGKEARYIRGQDYNALRDAALSLRTARTADLSAQAIKNAALDAKDAQLNALILDTRNAQSYQGIGDNTSVLATGSTTARSLKDRFADVVNVRDFGAKGDGVTDDTAAIQAATAAANFAKGEVYFPSGTYLVSAPIASAASGVHFRGAGMSAVRVKASAAFAGSALFILGNKATTAVVDAMGMERLTLDTNAVAGVGGFEFYGLREGSRFADIRVENLVNAPGVVSNQAGNGTGVSTLRMCESVELRNVHVLPGQNHEFRGTEGFRFDGINESVCLNCSFRGSGTADMGGSAGFRIGTISEVRGLSIVGGNVAYLKDLTIIGGVPVEPSYGILWGQWVRESWSAYVTFEEIAGSAGYFHGGTASGTLLPYNVHMYASRLYRDAEPEKLNPAFRFGDASACSAEIDSYRTDKVWGQFDAPVASQRDNTLVFVGEVASDNLASVVSFAVGSSATNTARGWANNGGTRNDHVTMTASGTSYSREVNGTRWEHVANQSRLALNGNSLLVEDENSVDRLLFGSTVTSLQTPELGGVALKTFNGTSVLGVQDTASGGYAYSTRAHLFDSYQEIATVAEPANPGAGKARVFVLNGGTGNALLGVRFPSGSTQILARESALISADRGDTSQTLTARVDAPTQRWATTLTANRTVTLSTTGAKTGDSFRVVRTGLGPFTLDVGGLKTIPSATAAFVDVMYDGAAWVLTGYGTL